MLEDAAPGVSNAARDILMRLGPHLLSAETLWQIFQSNLQSQFRRNVANLLAMLQWWESLPYLLQAWSSGDDGVREVAMRRIEEWQKNYNLLAVRPMSEQVDRLERAAGIATEKGLSKTILDHVRRALKHGREATRQA
jgi:hypothetical protein